MPAAAVASPRAALPALPAHQGTPAPTDSPAVRASRAHRHSHHRVRNRAARDAKRVHRQRMVSLESRARPAHRAQRENPERTGTPAAKAHAARRAHRVRAESPATPEHPDSQAHQDNSNPDMSRWDHPVPPVLLVTPANPEGLGNRVDPDTRADKARLATRDSLENRDNLAKRAHQDSPERRERTDNATIALRHGRRLATEHFVANFGEDFEEEGRKEGQLHLGTIHSQNPKHLSIL